MLSLLEQELSTLNINLSAEKKWTKKDKLQVKKAYDNYSINKKIPWRNFSLLVPGRTGKQINNFFCFLKRKSESKNNFGTSPNLYLNNDEETVLGELFDSNIFKDHESFNFNN